MVRFVAREGDFGGKAALRVLEALGCFTSCLNGEGVAGPDDIVFFTGDPDMHWPSKWLRTSPRHLKARRPHWADKAQAVIAIRPGKDLTEEGFKTAVVSVAQAVGALPRPPKRKKSKPVDPRVYASRRGY